MAATPVPTTPYSPDAAALDQLVAERFISRRKHPAAELWILNYTPRAQFERHWNLHTRACRGLILDAQYQVVQRPFAKFFNLGEDSSTELPDEPFEVYEKVDGSLGILYWGPDGAALATRGAFESSQAVRGTRILRERYASVLPRLDPTLTYLFEIIYPENRIIVDYGDREDLVLLAVLETASGRDLPLDDFQQLGFPVVQRYDGIRGVEELLGHTDANREGYVVRFASGFRIKVKLDTYLRVARLMTHLSPRHIWEMLRDGQDPRELAQAGTAEFQAWVQQQVEGLQNAYCAIEVRCRADFKDLGDRRLNARYYQTCPYPSVLFQMLDQRPYAETIWKMVRPRQDQPFLTDLE